MKRSTGARVMPPAFAQIVAGAACSLPIPVPPLPQPPPELTWPASRGGLPYDKWWSVVAGANGPNGSPEADRGRRHPRQVVPRQIVRCTLLLSRRGG
jgi:hypothetical protein